VPAGAVRQYAVSAGNRGGIVVDDLEQSSTNFVHELGAFEQRTDAALVQIPGKEAVD
jgi:hypothetical protein